MGFVAEGKEVMSVDRITPELIDAVFDETVEDALPKDKDIKHGVAVFNRSQTPEWRKNQAEGVRKKFSDEDWAAKKAAQVRQQSESDEWRAKVKEGNRRKCETEEWKAMKQRQEQEHKRAIMTPDGEFPSMKAAAEHYGVSPSAVTRWKNTYPDLYYSVGQHKEYANKGKPSPNKGRPLVTPGGVFQTVLDAMAFYNMSRTGIKQRMKSKPEEYYYISKEEYEQRIKPE